MHTHPGVEFDLVESGTLTVNSEGDADVVRGGGEPATGPLSGEEFGAGDLVVFPSGTGMNLVNNSDEDVVLLSAVFHPVSEGVPSTRYTEGEPAADAFDGVSFQVLGDGIIQTFPEGTATVSIQDVLVPAGTDLPASTGASLYSLVDGNFGFSVQGGEVQVSRTASPGLRPNAAPQQEFTLEPGDAAVFPQGLVAAPRGDQDSELSVLRLTAEPSSPFSGQPAEIEFLAPTEEAEPEEQVFTEIAVGAVVVTNTGSVNARTEPTTGSDVVEQLDEGVELTVIGGPEEADDFTWWQVDVNGAEAWVAADFIELANAPETEPEATEEPAAESTPAAGTPEAAPDADFATGDIVMLTEDNVRVRGEATINSEPVDVFAAGTEFEVTGDPVEADDFTWYPVTLVADDSVSGWVAVDFLEPADDEDE
jgi:uncharacterized protein YgiM (DUF1202 family)